MPRAREPEQEVPDRLRPRRKRLTVDKQAEIVELLKTTMLSHEAIGNKYGVSRQTVTAIQKRSKSVLKEMECLRGLALTGREHTRRVLTARHPLHPVDLAVYRWLQLVEENGAELSVTGAVLQARALDFAGALGFPAFKASNGWLQNFTKRFGVHSCVRSGEAASLLITADVQHRINTIITALHEVEPECIWNIDESALFYRSVSARTYATRTSRLKGVKVCKDRVTVTMCASADGEKLPLQVIGTAENPRALLKGDHYSNYGVYYHRSAKGWQTNVTFGKYVNVLNELAKDRNQTFNVIVDNASSHALGLAQLRLGWEDTFVEMQYDRLFFHFLPPNTTCRFQPIDMGMGRSLKANFRRLQLRDLFVAFDHHIDASPIVPFKVKNFVTLHQAIQWIRAAWDSVTPNSIRRCWVKATILPAPALARLNEEIDRGTPTDDAAMGQLAELLAHTSIKAKSSVIDGYVSAVRADACVAALVSHDANEAIDEIDVCTASVISYVQDLVGPAPSPHERDDTVDMPFDRPLRTATIDVPSSQRALSASESLREYFAWYEDDDMLAKLNAIVQRIETNASHTTPSAVFHI